MLTKYPYLKDSDPNGYAEPGETWLDSVPTGWRDLFFKTLDSLNNLLDNFNIPRDKIVFLQVKEKYGALRVYWSFEDFIESDINWYMTISDLFTALEQETEKTCNVCGAPATWKSLSWILPWCDECKESIIKANPDNNNFFEMKGADQMLNGNLMDYVGRQVMRHGDSMRGKITGLISAENIRDAVGVKDENDQVFEITMNDGEVCAIAARASVLDNSDFRLL
jgi:hypothetical protein